VCGDGTVISEELEKVSFDTLLWNLNIIGERIKKLNILRLDNWLLLDQSCSVI
jgi:hypothetical protein